MQVKLAWKASVKISLDYWGEISSSFVRRKSSNFLTALMGNPISERRIFQKERAIILFFFSRNYNYILPRYDLLLIRDVKIRIKNELNDVIRTIIN